jgi:hypothetical protein
VASIHIYALPSIAQANPKMADEEDGKEILEEVVTLTYLQGVGRVAL